MSDFIPYGRQSISDDDVSAVADALGSDWLTQGPRVVEFEAALAEYCGVAHAVAVNNGTAALHLAHLAAGVSPGDEVITTPLTFMATPNAALYCGATPVFADVEEDSGNIDPAAIAGAVTPATKAVSAVHLNGLSCDMRSIVEAVDGSDAVIIEDASHALGATYGDGRVGSCEFSDMATLSFHPVKLITTGEGGAVLTNDADLNDRLRALREHGIVRDSERFVSEAPDADAPWHHEMQELGYNYRITDLQCALGLSQLARLDEFVAVRTAIAARYDELLQNVEGVRLPARRAYGSSAWHLYAIRVDAGVRRSVFDAMRAAEIGVQVHYIPVHTQPYYVREFGDRSGVLPNAERYYAEALSLPMFPGLAPTEQDRVVSALKEALA